jgi:hypothetical protein
MGSSALDSAGAFLARTFPNKCHARVFVAVALAAIVFFVVEFAILTDRLIHAQARPRAALGHRAVGLT